MEAVMITWQRSAQRIIIAMACSIFGLVIGAESSAQEAGYGETVVKELQRRYDDSATSCGADAKIPVACSGVLIGSDVNMEPRRFWNPPVEINKAIPVYAHFTFLRHDILTSHSIGLGKDAYFYVVIPPDNAPTETMRFHIRCAFVTNPEGLRRENRGCGPSTISDAAEWSKTCARDVKTGAQWLAFMRKWHEEIRFPDVATGLYFCSFDLEGLNATSGFNEWLAAEHGLQANDFGSTEYLNAFRVEDWQPDKPEAFPIEALVSPSKATLWARQRAQESYFNATGRFVPIIQIADSVEPRLDKRFYYDFTDQAIDELGNPRPEIAAVNIQARAKDRATECGTNKSAAYLCSGILLRGYATTDRGETVWKVKPKDLARGGVSASYLRIDATFTKLAYDHSHGIIFYPPSMTPKSQNPINVLCAFPIDAYTDERTPTACDAHSAVRNGIACQKHSPPIVTASAWIADFMSKPEADRRYAQCGFDLRSPTAALFNTVLDAARRIAPGTLGDATSTTIEKTSTQSASAETTATVITQNELILAPWSDQIPKAIPIQAFFYVDGNTAGLTSARIDQRTLATVANGRWVPVVRLTLPSEQGGTPRVTYSRDDQDPNTPIPW